MSKIKVTLVKSTIGVRRSLRESVFSLGLRKINSSRIHEKSADILGKINKVSNILKVEDLNESK